MGIRTTEIHASDSPYYDIMEHFSTALDVYNDVQAKHGKLVIHCVAGLNRSPAIALALYMWTTKTPLSTAATHINDIRGSCLSNCAFAKQLVLWARHNNLLG